MTLVAEEVDEADEPDFVEMGPGRNGKADCG